MKNKLERKREGGRENTQSLKKRSWGGGVKDGAHEVLHTRRDIMELGGRTPKNTEQNTEKKISKRERKMTKHTGKDI